MTCPLHVSSSFVLYLRDKKDIRSRHKVFINLEKDFFEVDEVTTVNNNGFDKDGIIVFGNLA